MPQMLDGRIMETAVDPPRRPFVVITAGAATPGARSSEETSMQYLLLIYGQEPSEAAPDDLMAAEYQEYGEFTAFLRAQERDARRRGAGADVDGDHRPGRRRQDAGDGRPVRRDEGGARRLLPGRGGRSRRGDPLRRDDPGRTTRLDRDPAGLRRAGRRPGPGTRPRRAVRCDRVCPIGRRQRPPTSWSTACSARSRAGRSPR